MTSTSFTFNTSKGKVVLLLSAMRSKTFLAPGISWRDNSHLGDSGRILKQRKMISKLLIYDDEVTRKLSCYNEDDSDLPVVNNEDDGWN